MSKPKKFEDFFDRTSNSIKKVDVLIAYDDKNGNINPYLNHIFCPECYIAALSFVHGKTPHLRSIPSSLHSNSCSYNYSYARKTTILKYLEKLTSEQVKNRLNSMMRQLMPSKNDIAELQSNLTIENNSFLFDEEENTQSKKVIKKTIRKQRLSGWIDSDISGKLYLFYGDVQISSEEKQSKTGNTYFRWVIKTKNKDINIPSVICKKCKSNIFEVGYIVCENKIFKFSPDNSGNPYSYRRVHFASTV